MYLGTGIHDKNDRAGSESPELHAGHGSVGASLRARPIAPIATGSGRNDHQWCLGQGRTHRSAPTGTGRHFRSPAFGFCLLVFLLFSLIIPQQARAGSITSPTPLALETPISVDVPAAGDAHFYSIDLKKGQGISAVITAQLSQGGLRMELLDRFGTSIAVDNQSPDRTYAIDNGETAFIDFIAPETATYFLKIYGYRYGSYYPSNPTGSYTLTVHNAWFNSSATAADRTFAGSPNMAEYAATGTYTTSYMGRYGNEMYFRVNLSAGNTIGVRVTSHVKGNMWLDIMNQRQQVLASPSYPSGNALGNGESLTLTWTAARSGVYFYRVRWDNTVAGTYDMTVKVNGVEVTLELDSDGDGLLDSAEFYRGTDPTVADTDGDGVSDGDEVAAGTNPLVLAANEYSLDETSQHSTIDTTFPLSLDTTYDLTHPKSDTDATGTTYYAVDLKKGQGISAVLKAHLTTGGLRMEILDRFGTTAAGDNQSPNEYAAINNGETAFIDFTAPETATYYLKIYGYKRDRYSDPTPSGSYTLAVHNAWFNPAGAAADRSFAGSPNMAEYAATGTYTTSYMGRYGNETYFRVNLSAGDTIGVSMTSHVKGNMWLDIMNQRQQVVASPSYPSGNALGNGESLILTWTAAQSGVYFYRVRWRNTDAGSYDLSVTINDAEVLPEQDTDNDGLLDSAEFYWGTDPTVADSDGDGVSDGDEVAAGTNPLVIAANEYGIEETSQHTSIDSAMPLALDTTYDLTHPKSDTFPSGATYYAINLQKGQGISAVLTAQIVASGLHMDLLDRFGLRIARDNRTAQNFSIGNGDTVFIDFTAPETATYYLKIFSYYRLGYNSYIYTSGRYDLTIHNAWFNTTGSTAARSFAGSPNTAMYAASGNYPAAYERDGNDTYYRVNLTAGDTLAVTMTSHATGGLSLGILSREMTDLAQGNTISQGHEETVTWTAVYSGVYFYRVRSSNHADGNYDLTVKINDAEVLPEQDTDNDGLLDSAEFYWGTDPTVADSDGDGVSDGDEVAAGTNPLVIAANEYGIEETSQHTSIDSAMPLALDTTYDLTHPKSDTFPSGATYYAINLQKGQGISAVLTAQIVASGLHMDLLDRFGLRIARDNRTAQNFSIGNGDTVFIDFTAPETATYYLKIFSYYRLGYNSYIYTSGRYDLTIHNAWFNTTGSTAARSFAGSPNTAMYAASGNYPAAYERDGNDTYYRVNLTAGDTLAVTMTSHATGGLSLGILSREMTDLAQGNTISQGHEETVTWTAVYSGVYFYRVRSSNHADGNYDLTVKINDAEVLPEQDTDNDGLLDSAEFYWGTDPTVADSDGDGVSDGDEVAAGTNPLVIAANEYGIEETSQHTSIDSAMPLALDTTYDLTHPKSDTFPSGATYYAINLQKGQGISAVLRPHLAVGGIRMDLLDRSGQSVNYNYQTFDSNGILDGGTGVIDFTAPETATYYLKVYGYYYVNSANWSPYPSGRYDLTIHNAWFNPGVEDGSREYHGSPWSAWHLGYGTYMVSPQRVEYYHFYATENTAVVTELTPHLDRGTVTLDVLDADFNRVPGAQVTGIASGSTGTSTASILTSGDYYLRITSSSAGYYELNGSGHDAVPIIDLQPAGYDFGDVLISGQARQGFTITNTGKLNLDIGAISTTDSAFVVDTNRCGLLLPGNSCSFYVAFRPRTVAGFQADLIIASNAATPETSFPLAGAGIDQCPDDPNKTTPGTCGCGVPESMNRKWYPDADGDGYGGPQNGIWSCTQPAGYAINSLDCNDQDATIHPFATDIPCDGIDQDCSRGDVIDQTCMDADRDGYMADVDCNDNNAAIHPGLKDDVCNGIDNDCDGAVDEDFVGSATSCGVGACAATGVQVCANGVVTDTCAPGTPVEERCDEIDNDCDGTVDEDFTDLGASCSEGLGVCKRQGVRVCAADGSGTTCSAQALTPLEPIEKTCSDTLDNDCDGQTDGLDPDCVVHDYYCDSDQDGHYANTAQNCIGVGCVPQGCVETQGDDCDDQNAANYPGNREICDGRDNDCNPLTSDGADEDWLGLSCDGPDSDLCREGSFICYGGTKTCDDQTEDNVEICDGIDNNCDGNIDENLYTDDCGVCDGDPTNDNTTCTQDCSGVWGGTATIDDCGVCDADPTNDNTTCAQDCNGVWGGNVGDADNDGVCDDVDRCPGADDTLDTRVYGVPDCLNRAPVANAGADRQLDRLGEIRLDGTASADADGDPLTYLWTIISQPGDGCAVFDSPTLVSPVLTVACYGSYRLGLVVDDGLAASVMDTVTLSWENLPPVADAGAAISLDASRQVCLDGRSSTDPNGDLLSYSWSLTKPACSAAELTGADTATPCLTPDCNGSYTVHLVVSDGSLSSAEAATTVNLWVNTPPVADAGADRSAAIGETVCFDGAASYDPDQGDAVETYSWALLSTPAGSGAALVANGDGGVCLTGDMSGDYVLQLIVGDGESQSTPDTAVVTVGSGCSLPADFDGDCDVDRDDIMLMRPYLRHPATEKPPFDLDGDGTITIVDVRRVVLQCTRDLCATQ